MMKSKISAIAILFFLVVTASAGQNNQKKFNPAGTWNFEAPSAPAGYNSGAIVVTQSGQKYNASISFGQSDYKILGENVRFENGVFSFVVFVEGQEVTVKLKSDNEVKMSGNATYSEGEIPLTLTKAGEKK